MQSRYQNSNQNKQGADDVAGTLLPVYYINLFSVTNSVTNV